MDLKEFLEKEFKNSPLPALDVVKKLVELESIERYLNVMFGVELDIKVKPAQKQEGRFYGTGIIEKIK